MKYSNNIIVHCTVYLFIRYFITILYILVILASNKTANATVIPLHYY